VAPTWSRTCGAASKARRSSSTWARCAACPTSHSPALAWRSVPAW